MTESPRLLVHVHLFYTEQVDFFISRLRNITIPFELAVTLCGPCKKAEDAFMDAFPGVRILQVPNCGYDIHPFLVAMRSYDLDNFDFVLKLHTKSSRTKLSQNHIRYHGDEFRNDLTGPVIGSRECFDNALSQFQDPTVGLVCSRNFITRREAWQNVPGTIRLCELYGMPYRSHYPFCAGTMFMCRTEIVRRMLTVEFTQANFPIFSKSGQAGTLAHSLETMFGIICYNMGYRIAGVHDSTTIRKFRTLYLKAIVHKNLRWQFVFGQKKRVLVDLSSLKHLNCGLGQVAYNYGRYFGSHASCLDFEVHLLLPRKFIGAFGNDVKYHNSRSLLSKQRMRLISFDAWHSIHQLSRFRPSPRPTMNILTVHDLNFMYEKGVVKQKEYLKRLQRKIDRADRVVCISNFVKTDLLRFMRVDKPVEVLYNGVEFMSDVQEQKPQLPGDGKFLFSIGQMMPKKNFHVLLDAMKLLPEYTLYLAGSKDTEYAEMIEGRIRDEHIENVFLLGEILHSEKVWLYNHCEAFVFPSLFEGFGLPVIEALSFGRPVVSSDSTSLKEIGGGHVFFLENFEPEHIAARIREAVSVSIGNPQMSADNMEYARSFSYEKHLGRYVEIYRELML